MGLLKKILGRELTFNEKKWAKENRTFSSEKEINFHGKKIPREKIYYLTLDEGKIAKTTEKIKYKGFIYSREDDNPNEFSTISQIHKMEKIYEIYFNGKIQEKWIYGPEITSSYKGFNGPWENILKIIYNPNGRLIGKKKILLEK
jgi:hypothetical protein